MTGPLRALPGFNVRNMISKANELHVTNQKLVILQLSALHVKS